MRRPCATRGLISQFGFRRTDRLPYMFNHAKEAREELDRVSFARLHFGQPRPGGDDADAELSVRLARTSNYVVMEKFMQINWSYHQTASALQRISGTSAWARHNFQKYKVIRVSDKIVYP
ncbi:hypothetical protein AG1IA_07149 [Rhizoctonia solani AG-1 IA]|uniref:Uncharacterized protein n=1 Tax=Thanatephorus cucumeris (strain AG1-IA) TaxID=983506 RepID=L8WPY3_THACA|nr:hypothetical protein AG1IA_07149 [Rhizoctonia solani AG-1 IA]